MLLLWWCWWWWWWGRKGWVICPTGPTRDIVPGCVVVTRRKQADTALATRQGCCCRCRRRPASPIQTLPSPAPPAPQTPLPRVRACTCACAPTACDRLPDGWQPLHPIRRPMGTGQSMRRRPSSSATPPRPQQAPTHPPTTAPYPPSETISLMLASSSLGSTPWAAAAMASACSRASSCTRTSGRRGKARGWGGGRRAGSMQKGVTGTSVVRAAPHTPIPA